MIKLMQNLQYANLLGSISIFSKELMIKKGGHGPKGPSFNSFNFCGLSRAFNKQNKCHKRENKGLIIMIKNDLKENMSIIFFSF